MFLRYGIPSLEKIITNVAHIKLIDGVSAAANPICSIPGIPGMRGENNGKYTGKITIHFAIIMGSGSGKYKLVWLGFIAKVACFCF